MGLVNKLKRAVEVLKEDESVAKGNDFEKYVVSLFDDKYFSIVQWSTDITRKHNRFVESDSGPDLIVRYVPKNEIFCVECKFRSSLFEDKLQWSDLQQLKRYQSFAREKSFLSLLLSDLVEIRLIRKGCSVFLLEKQNILRFILVYLKNSKEMLASSFSGKMEC